MLTALVLAASLDAQAVEKRSLLQAGFAVMDLSTIELCLKSNPACGEGNSWGQTTKARVAHKVLFVGAFALGEKALQPGHPKGAKVLHWLGLGFQAVGILRNAQVAFQGRRKS